MKIPKWMNPVWYGLLFAAICGASLRISPDNYQLMMRTPKYIEFDSSFALTVLLLSFSFFAFLAVYTGKRKTFQYDNTIETLAAFLSHRQTLGIVLSLYGVTLLAYIIWFLPTFNLSVLTRIVVQHAIKGREVGNQISGVTTLTQLGPVVGTVSALALCLPADIPKSVKRIYRALLISLICFSCYRALIWSERLGLIEIVLPAIVLYFAFRLKSNLIRESAPIFAVVAMIALFGVFEYFRSWQYYKAQYASIVGFSVDRFLSYYYTSFNNFGMAHREIGVIGEPTNIFRFLYTLPIPFNPLSGRFEELTFIELKFALQRYVNPEFNLFTAPGLVYLDVGLFWGAIVFGLMGYMSGRIYRSFKNMDGVGLFLYPIWMVGLLEIGRQLQWTSGRELPQILGALMFAYLFNRYRQRRHASKQE